MKKKRPEMGFGFLLKKIRIGNEVKFGIFIGLKNDVAKNYIPLQNYAHVKNLPINQFVFDDPKEAMEKLCLIKTWFKIQFKEKFEKKS
jgi:hypothetical protein